MTDPYNPKSEKPCRACSDFSQWMKVGPSKKSAEVQESVQKFAEQPELTKKLAGSKKQSESSGSDSKDLPNVSWPNPDQALIDFKSNVCPPDRSELGSATWNFLHSVAAYFPATPDPSQQEDARQLLNIVSRLYPCSDCAEDLRLDLKEEPPVVTSSSEFSQWMCRLHNKVNLKLGKPQFDCSRIFERWRDGWKDGSCD